MDLPVCKHKHKGIAARLRAILTASSGIAPIEGVIYWHVANFTEDMDKFKILFAFERAFSKWQTHFSPIRFESTDDRSKAAIVMHFKQNGDRDLPESFAQNVLAYAFFPQGESLGVHSDMYLNDALNWSEFHAVGAYNLWKVVVHELGHSFGLEHSTDIRDIMYPSYQPNDEVNITQDTIDGITKLYGKIQERLTPKPEPVPVPVPPKPEEEGEEPSIEPEKEPEGSFCEEFLDFFRSFFQFPWQVRRLNQARLYSIVEKIEMEVEPGEHILKTKRKLIKLLDL